MVVQEEAVLQVASDLQWGVSVLTLLEHWAV